MGMDFSPRTVTADGRVNFKFARQLKREQILCTAESTTRFLMVMRAGYHGICRIGGALISVQTRRVVSKISILICPVFADLDH
jgi:hypothetical protein